MATLKPSSWTTFYNEVEALFKYDSQVHIVYDEPGGVLCFYVDDANKADALDALLPSEITFGDMTVDITFCCDNKMTVSNKDKNIYEVAFEGNEAISFIKTVKGAFSDDLIYVVFKNEVVQYFNDDFRDVYGQCSTLYQNIAKNVFRDDNSVFFCTDVPETRKNELKSISWP